MGQNLKGSVQICQFCSLPRLFLLFQMETSGHISDIISCDPSECSSLIRVAMQNHLSVRNIGFPSEFLQSFANHREPNNLSHVNGKKAVKQLKSQSGPESFYFCSLSGMRVCCAFKSVRVSHMDCSVVCFGVPATWEESSSQNKHTQIL